MSNFIYYEKLQDYEEQVRKAKEYDKLKQENERLKKLDENYPIEEELAEAYRREEDYKSRIEKADEYIDVYLKNVDDIDINIVVVKDILNGRSDE